MWYYYSKKSCNSPRKICYIRYLINRTTKRTTRMIIEKRKKRKKNHLHETFHRIRSRQFTKTIKTVPIPYSIKAFHRKIGEEGVEKKIFSTLCEQCLRGGGTISRNMKTASKSDGGRSEIGKQRFAQSCARKAWNCVRRAIATNNYYQADPFVWHRRK